MAIHRIWNNQINKNIIELIKVLPNNIAAIKNLKIILTYSTIKINVKHSLKYSVLNSDTNSHFPLQLNQKEFN